MDTFSLWHWLIVAMVIGLPIWLIVRSRRKVAAGGPQVTSQLVGIGGWLGLLAFGLCVSLLRNIVEFLNGMSDFSAGWSTNPAARGPLALVFALVACVSRSQHLGGCSPVQETEVVQAGLSRALASGTDCAAVHVCDADRAGSDE
jgi:hypothetical protein